MLNPFKLLAIYSDLNKMQAVTKEKATMMMKISQMVTLLVALLGTIGVPALAQSWLHAHLLVYTGFVVAAIVLHAIFPSIFSAPSAADTQATGLNKLGLVLLMLGIAASWAASARAQSTISNPPAPAQIQNVYAAGPSWSVNASPPVAGTALYARNLNTGASLPTFAFTVIDAAPNTLKPFTVTSNIGVGIAQQVLTVHKVAIYVPTAAGISWTGANTGWQWNGGALVSIPLKNNLYLMPSVRFLKSSVSNGTGYQPIIGLLLGWGQ